MKIKEYAIYAWLLLLALSVAALAARADELPSYNLTIKGNRFQPESIEIPAGKKVKLIVKNEDATAEEFESSDLNREKVIPGGKSLEVLIGPLRPGTYGFFGDFHPDTAKGQLVVK